MMNTADHPGNPPSGAGGPQDPGRRRFLRRALIGGALLAAGAAGVGLSGRLRRREIAATLPRLPRNFRGLRVGVVSDLHRGDVVSEEHCQRAASLLRRAKCDAIVNLGDNVTGSADYAASALAAFRALQPPAGKFAVTGNHDHWTDLTQVSQALEEARFRVLNDEHVALERGGQQLYIVGIRDLWITPKPDLDVPFSGVPTEGCVIVLSHNPDAIYHARVREADLVLAGHTHGGQVLGSNRFIPNCKYGRAHPHGLYREGNAQIYVTSGVGVISPAIRLGVPPEVVVMTLT